jgi:predicted nuclease with TOPRIM domain
VPTIREQMQARLEELKKELETGQAELQKVEMQRTYLRETVLRIDGAVQVLEELLARQPQGQQNGSDHSEASLEPTQERARKEADRSVTQQIT